MEEPNGPFSSVGVTSLIKLGTKTEKAPPERPYKNLPVRKTPTFLIKHSPLPTITIKLVAWMHVFFPNLVKGAEDKAPIAIPIDVIVLTAVKMFSCSFSDDYL